MDTIDGMMGGLVKDLKLTVILPDFPGFSRYNLRGYYRTTSDVIESARDVIGHICMKMWGDDYLCFMWNGRVFFDDDTLLVSLGMWHGDVVRIVPDPTRV